MDSEWMQLPANSLESETKQLQVVAIVAEAEQQLWWSGAASSMNFSTLHSCLLPELASDPLWSIVTLTKRLLTMLLKSFWAAYILAFLFA